MDTCIFLRDLKLLFNEICGLIVSYCTKLCSIWRFTSWKEGFLSVRRRKSEIWRRIAFHKRNPLHPQSSGFDLSIEREFFFSAHITNPQTSGLQIYKIDSVLMILRIKFSLKVRHHHCLMLFWRGNSGDLASGASSISWSLNTANGIFGRPWWLCFGDFHLVTGRRTVVTVFWAQSLQERRVEREQIVCLVNRNEEKANKYKKVFFLSHKE